MEFFVEPGTDEEWHQYWIDDRMHWYVDLGIKPDNLRLFEHPLEKLSATTPSAPPTSNTASASSGSEWGELEGIANRTDFDLSTHTKHSGTDLCYFNQATDERYTPYVIEPAAGLTRVLHGVPGRRLHRGRGAERQGRGGQAHRAAAGSATGPGQGRGAAAVPQRGPVAQGQGTGAALRKNWNIDFDDAGAIGRRYRRQDEIGTPFCITVDFDTLEDQAVTIRERDSMAQERVSLDKVEGYLAARLIGA